MDDFAMVYLLQSKQEAAEKIKDYVKIKAK